MDFHREKLRPDDKYTTDTTGATQSSWRDRLRSERRQRAAAVAADPHFVGRTAAAVARQAAQLRGSAFWASVDEAMTGALLGGGGGGGGSNTNSLAVPGEPPIHELVCYGLGELDDISGSHQLALVTLLAERFGLGPERVLAFDPVFTPQEHAVLRVCGCTPLAQDEQAARVATKLTLFYMPHCPFDLYNRLVHANWRTPWHVLLLGNDLRFHALHNHPFETVAPQLSRAMRVMSHVRLPDTYLPPAADPPACGSGGDAAATQGSAGALRADSDDIGSTQIFGLGSLYTFPDEDEFLRQLEADNEEEDWRGLASWMRDGPGELPVPQNLRARLEQELAVLQQRSGFLSNQLAAPAAPPAAAKL
jgi:hypothetical protein